jgi:hypothetical protein
MLRPAASAVCRRRFFIAARKDRQRTGFPSDRNGKLPRVKAERYQAIV